MKTNIINSQISHLQLGPIIGQVKGGEGCVYIARLNKEQKIIVVKIAKAQRDKQTLETLEKLNHPFIVNKIAKCLSHYPLDKQEIELLEYIKGIQLYQYCKGKQLSNTHALFYISQVTMALQYLHDNLIIYRDLKPENIIISESGYAKLVDFGFCKKLSAQNRTYTQCGTAYYQAPEVIQGKTGYSFEADYWSLGILLFELLTGKCPFSHLHDPYEIYQAILNDPIIIPKCVDKWTKNLIQQLLIKEQNLRRAKCCERIENILQHKSFQKIDLNEIESESFEAHFIPHTEILIDWNKIF